MNAIILDIATAAHPCANDWIEPGKPPANYRRPEAIAAWQAEDGIERLAKAGLDPDLCVVTCIGVRDHHGITVAVDAHNEEQERVIVTRLAGIIRDHPAHPLVGFNVKSFDLAILKRRARYLEVSFPDIDLGRYRNDRVIDIMEVLYPDREKRKSLDFLCKRLGYHDLLPKPLSGELEAQIFSHGRWEELRASVVRDVEAVARIGLWAGVL